jgi:hypothetical protein
VKPSADLALAALMAAPDGLTALEAAPAVGYSLAQRVHELRRAGHTIRDSWETTPNGARIKRYAYVAPVAAAPLRGQQAGWLP